MTIPYPAEVPADSITVPVQVSPAIEAGEIDTSIVMGAPDIPGITPERVSVYFDSCTQSSYNDTDPVISFDLVFCVSVFNNTEANEICQKTYKVVKRIGIDRCKIAVDAQSSVPITVVESVKEAAPSSVTSNIKQEFRRLAGLE